MGEGTRRGRGQDWGRAAAGSLADRSIPARLDMPAAAGARPEMHTWEGAEARPGNRSGRVGVGVRIEWAVGNWHHPGHHRRGIISTPYKIS